MSADNGYLLRKNEAGEYKLQPYMGEDIPPIDAPHAMTFLNVEDALLRYSEIAKNEIIEYGLSVDIKEPTLTR